MKKLKVNMVSESEISVRGHGVHTAYIELIKALQKRRDCELVVNDFTHKTNADVMHLHTLGLHSVRKLIFGNARVKIVSAHVVPASFIGSIVLARLWLPLAKAYLGWFYRRADRVLAVSKTVAHILEYDLGVKREKIILFYNSIDTSQYRTSDTKRLAARRKLGLSKSAFVVMGNGQVQPRKRLDTFISVARAYPDLFFFWVGGISFKYAGADYRKMQNIMKNVPKNMKITGVIELEEVKEYLLSSDVFMLPAEQENHPMAVIEAASAHLPIILRDIPEYHDTFGDDALLAADDRGFIDQLGHVWQDAALRKHYQKSASAIAYRFDSSVAAEKLMQIYREALASL